jgi:proline iminopeptidase
MSAEFAGQTTEAMRRCPNRLSCAALTTHLMSAQSRRSPAAAARDRFTCHEPAAAAVTTDELKPRAGAIDVEGARLEYRVEGRGQPCLIIGSSAYYPRVFSQELREHLQLVFVDVRQFAVSDPAFSPERISSIEAYLEDIEHVRRSLELHDVILIGHSLHGTIALEYARRYPANVRGVVAVAAPAYRSHEDPSQSERFWLADASEERKEIVASRLAELTPDVCAALSPAELWLRRYQASAPKIWFDPTYDDSWLWEGVELNGPVYQRVAGELFKPYDLAEIPGEIDVPALVIHGRYDYWESHTLWEGRLHKLTRHTFVLFERSGHMPSLEEPERFNEVLLAWIGDLARPPMRPTV